MAFKCGFFNSINGDRKYNADDMMNPIKGIVSDGVVADDQYSDGLQVQAHNGLEIVVKKGYGKFNNKWCELDADELISVPKPHVTATRIDSIIVKIDVSDEVRNGVLEYRQGSTTPPELERNNLIMEYRLANITVAPNATVISQANIEDTRAGSECGFVTNLLQNSDISATYAQWQKQFNEFFENGEEEYNSFVDKKQSDYNSWSNAKKEEYDRWFNNLTSELIVNNALMSYSSIYTTKEEKESVIPINIFDYTSNTDILRVYVNGMLLNENIDYTKNDFSTITLKNPVDKNTLITFSLLKTVVSTGEVETVLMQLQKINSLIPVECDENNQLADKQFVNDSIDNQLSRVVKKITKGLVGRKWTRKVCNSFYTYSLLDFANGLFFLSLNDGTTKTIYSKDGLNWAETNLETFLFIEYAKNVYVACSLDKNIYYSYDGIFWTKSETFVMPENSDFPKMYDPMIVFAKDKFYVGTTGGMFTSTDGVNWTKINEYKVYTLLKYKNLLIAGINNGLIYSEDGENWTQTEDIDVSIFNVRCANGILFAGSDATTNIYYSEDGKYWYETSMTGALRGVSYINDVYVIGTRNIYYSTNLTTYVSAKTASIKTMACDGNIVIAGTSDGFGIYYSYDGINWKQDDRRTVVNNLFFENDMFLSFEYNTSDKLTTIYRSGEDEALEKISELLRTV